MYLTNELSKKKIYDELSLDVHILIAEQILPKLFFIIEKTVGAHFRGLCIKIVDKLISVLSDELVSKYLEPKTFSKSSHSILKSNQIDPSHACLKMLKKVLQASPATFLVPLLREGISHYIKEQVTRL